MKTLSKNFSFKKIWLSHLKKYTGLSLSTLTVVGTLAYAGETPVYTNFLQAEATTTIEELCNNTLDGVGHDTYVTSKTRAEWLALTELNFNVSIASYETNSFLWEECTYTLFVSGDASTADFTTNFPDQVITSSGSYPGSVSRNFTGSESADQVEYKVQISIRAEPSTIVTP